MTNPKASEASGSAVRCGILLSAGNSMRLRELVHQRRGDYLPKQYVNFVGSRSMLEHTWDRAEKLIPAQRLFIVVAKEHVKIREVHRQLVLKPPQSMVIQPANRETAAEILLPLLYVNKRYPDAIVTVFPADHFILEEDLFMRHVDDAFRVVESDASRLVLLGLEPYGPDPEYGYIVPGGKIDAPRSDSARQVEMFVEKPSIEAAKKIIASGALWSTKVLVFATKTFLSIIEHAAPELYRSFEPVQDAIGTPDEQLVIEQVYQNLPPLDFSKDVLEALPFEHRSALVVLPVRGVNWSDWGTSDRLSNTLRQMGFKSYAQPDCVSSQQRNVRLSSKERPAAITRIH